MKKCLEILASPSGRLSSDPEEDFMTRENALEHLESVVDIDNAKGTDRGTVLFQKFKHISRL